MTEEREQLWLGAPARPALSGGEVHVWHARLDVDAATLRGLWESLSADERARADRFHFRVDREHFIAARGGLRAVLGLYTGAEPRRLRFAYDAYGKPSLDGEEGGGRLRFNVSHSKGVALYALALGRAVGVDIEFVREDFASLEIAEHFFSMSEVASLRAVAERERASAFFDCWTRKEAYIKALGEGLSHPLHLFTVSLAPGQPAALLSTEGEPQEAARWSLLELFPGEGFRAALAVEGETPSVRCWRWP